MCKEKECIVCGKKFIPNSNNQKYCSKECFKIARTKYNKKYCEENRNMILLNKKNYYEKNKDKILEKQHNLYNENKNKLIKNQKVYYERNKNNILEYNKKYYENNKDKISEYNKKYYKNNKYKRKEYRSNKLKTDINYKMTKWCRNQIYRCINSKKDKHTFDILNYTPTQLREHLEKQFKNGMNWSNHGTLWHIDHIRPLCSFNFELPNGEIDYEQVKIANSLQNLQPLLKQENISKGGKFQ